MRNSEKISLLKNSLEHHGIDTYLVPSFDEFQNEVAPENLQRLKWLTDFTGSNGLALITKTQNYLLTDGRYITQANKQLVDVDFQIYDMQDVEEIYDNIFEDIKSKFLIGYDPTIFTCRYLEQLTRYFKHHKRYIKLIPIADNLIDNIWNRPKYQK